MTHPFRVIDANANRAREALRVMEDAARFILNDAHLCARLKELRHSLAGAMGALDPSGAAIAWRDTPGDVATTIEGEGEYQRAGLRDVAVAAGKRLTEALRTIEEFAKALPTGGEAARAFERLRYGAYECERLLVLRLGGAARAQWRLCVLLSAELCALPWLETAQRVMRAGADCLQLREKSMDSRELLDRARALADLAHKEQRPGRARCAVIVNDRPDIALLAGADGVHLGQHDMPVSEARRIVGTALLIGVSTANLEQARAARLDGADYCGVGPMFATSTKHKPVLAGPEYLRAYLRESPELPPHLAIGGISPENAGLLRAEGVRGIAVSSAVCGSREPEKVCAALIGLIPATVIPTH